MRNPLVLSLCIAALFHSHLQSACRQCFFDPFIAVCSCIVQFIASRGCSVLCHCRADAGLCIGFQTGFISCTRPGKQRNCMFAHSAKSDVHTKTIHHYIVTLMSQQPACFGIYIPTLCTYIRIVKWLLQTSSVVLWQIEQLMTDHSRVSRSSAVTLNIKRFCVGLPEPMRLVWLGLTTFELTPWDFFPFRTVLESSKMGK